MAKTAIVYITKDEDCYHFGWQPSATLHEFSGVSRTWFERLEIELPEGYEIAEDPYGEERIWHGESCCDLLPCNDDKDVLIRSGIWDIVTVKPRILRRGWDF